MVTIRYESTHSSFFTRPFELGTRHLKVAFCNGSQANLTHLAKERIIYRADEANNDQFVPLTKKQRVYHAIIGLGETVGYLTIIVPFIVAAVDKFFNKRQFNNLPPQTVKNLLKFTESRQYIIEIHQNEGGIPLRSPLPKDNYRKNPFSESALLDDFYIDASCSWLTESMVADLKLKLNI